MREQESEWVKTPRLHTGFTTVSLNRTRAKYISVHLFKCKITTVGQFCAASQLSSPPCLPPCAGTYRVSLQFRLDSILNFVRLRSLSAQAVCVLLHTRASFHSCSRRGSQKTRGYHTKERERCEYKGRRGPGAAGKNGTIFSHAGVGRTVVKNRFGQWRGGGLDFEFRVLRPVIPEFQPRLAIRCRLALWCGSGV